MLHQGLLKFPNKSFRSLAAKHAEGCLTSINVIKETECKYCNKNQQ